MNGEGSISEGKAILSRDQKDPGPARLPRALLRPPQFYEGRGLSVGQVSRRTFIQGLGAIGAGSIFFSTGIANHAATGRPQWEKGQNVRPYIDELSAEQLTNFVFRYSYLVFRTTKDEQRFTRQADMLKIRLWETKIKDLVISYFVIRISYFERRKTNNASRGRPTC